jgi:hypothetical protein
MIYFACSRCRKPFAARDEIAGRRFHCPRCKGLITAPVPPEFTLLRPPSLSLSRPPVKQRL